MDHKMNPYVIWLMIILLVILILSCNSAGGNGGEALNDDLVIQATLHAINDKSLTQQAEEEQAAQRRENDSAFQSTLIAFSVLQTSIALQSDMLTKEAVHPAPQTLPQQPNPQQQQPSIPQQNPAVPQNVPQQPAGTPEPAASPKPALEPFDTWKNSASILLYEDMAGVLDNNRTVRDAFESLGIKPSRDEKDSSGFFLGDIRAGGPGGKPWDLIISASEVRTAVQGEFIPPLNEAVGKGSSLIMEQWNLDSINFGKISTLMARCGVSLQADKAYNPLICEPPRTYEGGEYPLILWAIDGTSPILHEPNDGLRLSSMSEYWTDWYKRQCNLGLWPWPWDYGDELQLTTGSKAKIILGTKTTDTDRHGMLVSCVDDRVILWTSSTHNYANDRVLPLWMNMIHNALKARYNYLSTH